MIELGKMQALEIVDIKGSNIYLAHKKDSSYKLPLIKEDFKPRYKIGDKIEVFVYREGQEMLVATTQRPYIQVGQLRNLRVIDKTKIGFFVDIGLSRDVLLPFSETRGHVNVGHTYLMKMYVDKSSRLALSMDIGKDLETHSPYNSGDLITGTIYGINKKIGIFLAVDEKYEGLISRKYAQGIYQIGEVISAKVLGQNDQGQLNLTLKGIKYGLDQQAEDLIDVLEDHGGSINLDYKSDPKKIKDITDLSKRDFKNVLDKLEKEGTVTVGKGKTRLR